MTAPERIWMDPNGRDVLAANTWPGAVEYVRADLVLSAVPAVEAPLVPCAVCHNMIRPDEQRVMSVYGTYHDRCYPRRQRITRY